MFHFDVVHAWPIYLESGYSDPIGFNYGIWITWGCISNVSPLSFPSFVLLTDMWFKYAFA